MKQETQHTLQVDGAVAAVRKCADTMESQATRLLQSLPGLPMDDSLRPAALALGAALKDTSGRALFEVALLQGEIKDGRADVTAVVRRLAGADSAMMEVVAAATDVVDQLERAADHVSAETPRTPLTSDAD